MNYNSGGFLTTLLMLVPVVAVPALAIFGVPNGDTLKASLEAEASPDGAPSLETPLNAAAPPREAVIPESELGEGFMPGGDATPSSNGWDDPFRDGMPPEARRAGNAERNRRTADAAEIAALDDREIRTPPLRSAMPPKKRATGGDASGDHDDQPFGMPPEEDGGKADSPPLNRGNRPGPAVVRPRFPEKNRAEANEPAHGDWRSAATRLKQYGISDFQLLPGDGDRQFVFLCRYASPNNPRVVRRFEAESDDPLQAVEQVLHLVDAWASGR